MRAMVSKPERMDHRTLLVRGFNAAHGLAVPKSAVRSTGVPIRPFAPPSRRLEHCPTPEVLPPHTTGFAPHGRLTLRQGPHPVGSAAPHAALRRGDRGGEVWRPRHG